MKKKFISFLLAVLLLSSVSAVFAWADGAAISVSTAADARTGEEVSLSVNLDANPGIAGINVTVVYDTERLSLISCEPTGFSGGLWNVNGNRAMWVNAKDSTYTGPILNLKFKVLDNAPVGKAAVTVTYKAGDICNAALEDVNPTITAGGVTIVCDHVSDNGVVTTEPGCETPGVKTYSCTVCGEVLKTEEIPALGHTSDAGKVTKEPTCTEKGVKTYTCTVCGEVLKTEEIPALGHTWDAGKVTTEPTCTGKGVKTYTCTVCGETKTEEIPALGHTWDAGKVTTEPTCTEKGVKTHTCTVCGETKTEEIPALGHTWDAGEVTTEPTCTEEGVKAHTCTVCGETKTEEIPALGHTWDAGEVTTEPTCTEEGVKTYTCTVCGETKTETIAKLDHEWDEGVVTREATSTTEGEKTYTCTVCGETKIEKIPVVKDDATPGTGDDSAPLVFIMALCLSAGAAAVLGKKLRKERS